MSDSDCEFSSISMKDGDEKNEGQNQFLKEKEIKEAIKLAKSYKLLGNAQITSILPML